MSTQGYEPTIDLRPGHELEVAAAIRKLMIERKELIEALEQATDQLEQDYEHTPLDGRAALIRKLRFVLIGAKEQP